MSSRSLPQRQLITGEAEMRSLPFSNHWELTLRGTPLARMRRFPRERVSIVELADRSRWELRPRGWGTVEAVADGVAFAEIVRMSWWGRRWDVLSRSYAYQLISRPLPRRWYFAAGSEPVAEWAGSVLSYNKLRVTSPIGVPLSAVLLAWQVVCRPWEQAAFPVQRERQPQRAAPPHVP
jgi:hypothetical protein